MRLYLQLASALVLAAVCVDEHDPYSPIDDVQIPADDEDHVAIVVSHLEVWCHLEDAHESDAKTKNQIPKQSLWLWFPSPALCT